MDPEEMSEWSFNQSNTVGLNRVFKSMLFDPTDISRVCYTGYGSKIEWKRSTTYVYNTTYNSSILKPNKWFHGWGFSNCLSGIIPGILGNSNTVLDSYLFAGFMFNVKAFQKTFELIKTLEFKNEITAEYFVNLPSSSRGEIDQFLYDFSVDTEFNSNIPLFWRKGNEYYKTPFFDEFFAGITRQLSLKKKGIYPYECINKY